MNGPGGPRDAVLTLTRTGETLSGTIKGAQGEYKVRGTQKGKEPSLSLTYTDDVSAVTLRGTVSGNAVSGQATFGKSAGTWTGKKSAASGNASSAGAPTSIDLTGVWAFEVTSPFGKGTPTVTFKQNGETLTGTYVGQIGEVPLEGSLKGSVLAFATDMAAAKLKVHILYNGTATKDELKGTIKYGDLGDGTFTARRK